MATRLDPPVHSRTTDHFSEIVHMRAVAGVLMARYPDASTTPRQAYYEVTILMAGAALLEVHDATGISLDDWVGPHQLVETALEIAGYDTNALGLPLHNHV